MPNLTYNDIQERFLDTLEREATIEEIRVTLQSPDLWPVLLLWWLRGIEEGKRRYSEMLALVADGDGSGPSVSC